MKIQLERKLRRKTTNKKWRTKKKSQYETGNKTEKEQKIMRAR